MIECRFRVLLPIPNLLGTEWGRGKFWINKIQKQEEEQVYIILDRNISRGF
jgi:hypothetical protein